MAFSVSGIASGIDTQSLIDGLMSVAKVPLQQLDARKKDIDSASTTISTFSSKLAALKTAALALSTTTGFSAFAASSSDTAVVASVSGSAAAASYAVEVSQLARGQKSRSDVFADGTTPLGQSGTLRVKVGSGTSYDVTVKSTDSLLDIANKLTGSGARISASLMSTGAGQRLLVQGLDSGAASAFTITESGTTLGLDQPAAVYQSAQDAMLTVDGMSVTAKTNQITGVIPGVTLALTKPTTSPATVSVAGDSSQLRTKINALVTAYNGMINTAHGATGWGSQKADNAVLAGDRSIRESLARVSRILGTAVPGTSGRYTTLASVGITLKQDGTMSFDASKMDAALSADAATVAKLFVTDTTSGATGLMKTMMTAIDGLVMGKGSPVQSRLDALSSQSAALQKSRDRMADRLDQYQAQLKKQFTDMDLAVSKYNSLQSAVAGIASGSGSGSGSSA